MTNLNYIIDELYSNPKKSIISLKEKNKKIFGYFCTYVPEEIIYAGKIVPVRILGKSNILKKADKHLQTYCCSQIRASLEDLFNNNLFLDGIIFSHSCDSMQSFFGIVKKNFPDHFIKNVNFPTKLNDATSFQYGLEEFKRFRNNLEEFIKVPITDSDIKRSVEIYNKNRILLNKVYQLHREKGLISCTELLKITYSSMIMDKEENNKLLEEFLNKIENEPISKVKEKRYKILIIGSLLVTDEIHKLLDEFNCKIFSDDLCTGKRYFDNLVCEPSIEGIFKRYFDKRICPAKHKGVSFRGEMLKNKILNNNIDRVLFCFLKFCDPHFFDYPYLKNIVDSFNIPSQLIELEQGGIHLGQLRTKIQALLEIN